MSIEDSDPRADRHSSKRQWAEDERWAGIERAYGAEEVVRLRGSVVPECTLARLGAERLWRLLTQGGYINALGALTGGQAVQMVQGRAAGDLPLRLAGRGRRERRGRDVSRPEPLPGELACRRSCAG